jgi:sulfoxide reductase heme-binding subunit YedZ
VTSRRSSVWPWLDNAGAFSWLRATALAVLLLPAASMIYDLRSGNFGPLPLIGFIYWSGVWATVLLLATLAVSPARRIFGWQRIVAVRRMIGVAAFLYSLVHLVVYFALHKWAFGEMGREIVTRLTLVVATLSLAGLTLLAVTSTDGATRRLGVRWKRLHRTNYALTLLAVAHYLLSPGIFSAQYVAAGLLFWLMSWRALERRGLGEAPLVLTALALAATVFTVALEAAWMWAYQHVDPLEPLGDNLTVEFGVPASWQVLAFGLVLAMAAFVVRSRPQSAARPGRA